LACKWKLDKFTRQSCHEHIELDMFILLFWQAILFSSAAQFYFFRKLHHKPYATQSVHSKVTLSIYLKVWIFLIFVLLWSHMLRKSTIFFYIHHFFDHTWFLISVYGIRTISAFSHPDWFLPFRPCKQRALIYYLSTLSHRWQLVVYAGSEKIDTKGLSRLYTWTGCRHGILWGTYYVTHLFSVFLS
jgi:hypothetical protein